MTFWREMVWRSCAAVLAIFAPDLAVAQDGIRLSLPVRCDLGTACFVQQYVDRDLSVGVKDFTCGGASYDGHKGTDFRVLYRDMVKGVPVLAAADGVVQGLRNSEPDKRVKTEADRAAVQGRECGNGVVIRHAGGWETQYCHMKQGSLTVAKAQTVKRGDVLGYIGLSGRTQFAHLHLSVRHDGQVVDPFQPSGSKDCTVDLAGSLWEAAAHPVLEYAPTQLLDIGIADRKTSLDDVQNGVFEGHEPAVDKPLVVYAMAINLRKGDGLMVRLSGPEGLIVASDRGQVDKRKAQLMTFAGKKAPSAGWPKGQYVARVEIVRNGAVLRRRAHKFEVR